MNCPNCNAIIDENDTICKSCGASLSSINNPSESMPSDNNPSKISSQSDTPAPSVPKNNGMAIASMVLGIVSIPLLCCYGVGIIPAILAVVLGFVSKKKIEESNGLEIGRGMSLAGIIIGFASFALGLIGIILMFAGVAFLNSPEFMEEFENAFEEGMRQ